MSLTAETAHHSNTAPGGFLEKVLAPVQDPRARLALTYCSAQLTEPALNLVQLKEALLAIRPKKPCSRTVQRWVQNHGMPCSRDFTGNRIYFLSQVLTWYQDAHPNRSIAEEGRWKARNRLVGGYP